MKDNVHKHKKGDVILKKITQKNELDMARCVIFADFRQFPSDDGG